MSTFRSKHDIISVRITIIINLSVSPIFNVVRKMVILVEIVVLRDLITEIVI